ncbi:DNA-binding response regulator, OmpR family, contains REC and winged-helix (wHTH) domain [Thiohalospira halophila DSM 15071]|uniref:DNA-binding response regulator, OmpR family, contains REC and winged-helix (WHTH) domain n=1 Tax=Thiohalospira halophila DSM 15071 TaxID=1123397 RepID=A0A1I1N699_9GAMM|nr:response regulator transcription factor [Thiohalospira halophila]SFC93139.1 DNA-binding response regulator, OmpR family, contains REC and winged-helix (wHTH) domain [Thiohalospira halophila DSM 15071]
MRVLVVEDDSELGAHLRDALREAGYAADITTDGEEAAYLGREEPYDAVVLDLGLPGRSGLQVLEEWRQGGVELPVLILTARDAWYERVEGFEAGADDYLGKPFHTEELLARLAALLRRHHGRAGGPLAVAGLRLDESRQVVVTSDGAEHELTGTEFRLLRYLMLNPGRVLSKTALTEHVYEYDAERDSNVVEVYIRRLRCKVGSDRIRTRRGQGYELVVD